MSPGALVDAQKGLHLAGDRGQQLAQRDGPPPVAEVLAIGVAGMGTDRDAVLRGRAPPPRPCCRGQVGAKHLGQLGLAAGRSLPDPEQDRLPIGRQLQRARSYPFAQQKPPGQAAR